MPIRFTGDTRREPLKKILAGLFGSGKKEDQDTTVEQPGLYTVRSSPQLLEPHVLTLEKIRECTSLRDRDWQSIYMPMFENMAMMVQLLPASAGHHHNKAGGLLAHTLEIALYAARAKRAVVYNSTGAENEVKLLQQAFTFACISAAVMHDLGKLVTDIIVVDKDTGKRWNPILGPMPVGVPYAFKWNRGHKRSKQDHEQASGLLVSLIIPAIGIKWLSDIDDTLYRLWISSITGHGEGFGGDVYNVVHRADIESAKTNLNAETLELSDTAVSNQGFKQVDGGARYFHEPFIKYWSNTLSDGSWKLNKPGAAAWVTDDHVLIVAPSRLVETVNALRSTVDRNLPQDIATIVRQLHDLRALSTLVDDAKTIFKLEIYDPEGIGQASEWKKELSFIAVPRELVDPNKQLENFKGMVVNNLDGNCIWDGVNVAHNDTALEKAECKDEHPKQPESEVVHSDKPTEPATKQKVETKRSANNIDSDNVTAAEISELVAKQMNTSVTPPSMSPDIARLLAVPHREAESDQSRSIMDEWANMGSRLGEPTKNDGDVEPKPDGFWEWLMVERLAGSLKVNQFDAPVHILNLGQGAQGFLVSPLVFFEYLEAIEQLDSKTVGTNSPQLIAVQKEFFKYSKHNSWLGRDIARFSVKSNAKRASIKMLSGVILSVDATKELFEGQYLSLDISDFIDTR